MKKIVVLLLVVLGIFSFGAMTMAEGGNIYLDLSQASLSTPYGSSGTNLNLLAVGGDYNQDAFTLGGYYAFGLGYTNGATSNDNFLFLNGGYNFIQGEASLGAIISYWNWSVNSNSAFSSLGIGLKGVVNFESGNVSALYSYGINNSMVSNTISDLHISVIELKGTYYISDSVGLHLVYRSIPMSYVGSVSLNDIGVGVDFKL